MLVQIVKRETWHIAICLLSHASCEYVTVQQNELCCNFDYDVSMFFDWVSSESREVIDDFKISKNLCQAWRTNI